MIKFFYKYGHITRLDPLSQILIGYQIMSSVEHYKLKTNHSQPVTRRNDSGLGPAIGAHTWALKLEWTRLILDILRRQKLEPKTPSIGLYRSLILKTRTPVKPTLKLEIRRGERGREMDWSCCSKAPLSNLVPFSSFTSSHSHQHLALSSFSNSSPFTCYTGIRLKHWPLHSSLTTKLQPQLHSLVFSSSSFANHICRAAEYKFPDPIPEFAQVVSPSLSSYSFSYFICNRLRNSAIIFFVFVLSFWVTGDGKVQDPSS